MLDDLKIETRNFGYIKEYLRCKKKKSIFRQISDILKIVSINKCAPDSYFKFGLYHSNEDAQVESYIPGRLVKKLQREMNPSDHIERVVNKANFRREMDAAGLSAIREVLCIDEKGTIENCEGKIVSVSEAAQILINADIEFLPRQ